MLLQTLKPFMFDSVEAAKTGFYTSGTTGCGKSDIAMLCADALRAADVTVLIFDPSQDWIERYPIDYYVKFNAPTACSTFNNDLPEVLLQDAIFDTSNLTTLQLQQVAEKFCWLLYRSQAELPKVQRKLYCIIFEEAQIVFPEGVMKSNRLQNVVRLATVGRNFGIRIGVITQFAAMVDKSAVRYMGQRFFGWTDEYNDVRRIGTMLGKEAAASLKFLKSGEFLYYCPSQRIQEKIAIEPYKSHKV